MGLCWLLVIELCSGHTPPSIPRDCNNARGYDVDNGANLIECAHYGFGGKIQTKKAAVDEIDSGFTQKNDKCFRARVAAVAMDCE